MFIIKKQVPWLACILITFFLTFPVKAYEVTLKGGSEIKQGAEILKQTAEIISKLISMESIKMLLLILLGFAIALQGVRMLSNGLSKFIAEQNSIKKGLMLSLLGVIFFCSGLAVIFIDEVFVQIQKKAITTLTKPKA